MNVSLLAVERHVTWACVEEPFMLFRRQYIEPTNLNFSSRHDVLHGIQVRARAASRHIRDALRRSTQEGGHA